MRCSIDGCVTWRLRRFSKTLRSMAGSVHSNRRLKTRKAPESLAGRRSLSRDHERRQGFIEGQTFVGLCVSAGRKCYDYGGYDASVQD
jgi:hypothetical protein